MRHSLLLERKLKINGRTVPVMGGFFDLSDFDLAVPVDPPKVALKKRPKCNCGSVYVGCKPYMAGHDKDCEVHEDKTPVSHDNPFYEKA